MFELVIQNELLENNNLFLKIHQQTKNTRGFHSHVTFRLLEATLQHTTTRKPIITVSIWAHKTYLTAEIHHTI